MKNVLLQKRGIPNSTLLIVTSGHMLPASNFLQSKVALPLSGFSLDKNIILTHNENSLAQLLKTWLQMLPDAKQNINHTESINANKYISLFV